jgi:hypothetical protein
MDQRAEMLTVVCFKWGTAFPADSVTVLHNAVRRNLDLPHRFICFTDNASGLAAGIETQPIPEAGIPPERWSQGIWPKLTVFKRGLLGDADIAIYFDLDLIVQASLAPFIERARAIPGVHIVREWNPSFYNIFPISLRPDRGGQGSVFAWRPAEQHHIFETFAANQDAAYALANNDQEYITKVAHDLHYWPHGWCVSFKRTCLWYPPLNRVFTKVAQPRDAKIVVFHGKPRPWDLVRDGNERWGTDRKFGFGPVDWVKAYWERSLTEAPSGGG